MKRILILCSIIVAVALATPASARTITKKLAEIGGTFSWTIADEGADTTRIEYLHNVACLSDGVGDADSTPQAWLAFTYTAASTDSLKVIIEYLIDGNVIETTQGALLPYTSGAYSVLSLIPQTDDATPLGFCADGFQVIISNTDITGTAAATAVQCWLVYVEKD